VCLLGSEPLVEVELEVPLFPCHTKNEAGQLNHLGDSVDPDKSIVNEDLSARVTAGEIEKIFTELMTSLR
jgi:hypothetical protein